MSGLPGDPPPIPPPGTEGITFHYSIGRYWVVRNEHLDFVGTMGATAAATATAVLAGGEAASEAAVTGIAAGAAVSTFQLAWKAWRKGATINELQYHVLAALKAVGKPMTTAQLEEAMRTCDDQPWNASRIETFLSRLQKVRLRDNTHEDFVLKHDDGTWSAADV